MRAGRIEAGRSTSERRAVEMRLSGAGATVTEVIAADMHRQETELLAARSAGERKTFLALLDKALGSADAATAALSAEACPPGGETPPPPRD